ncbi:LVIS_2131 family protein [uncultured Limosilactobacillus sp.]|uniref:LVIS_2131 family protein n=1 Tax=uncultured Limosilactobacillus sp. TaxID=2837629 RepID=UPI0025F6331A|nr:LVIS_2131 family protein [uncultured Limosilactobacillus sp.]
MTWNWLGWLLWLGAVVFICYVIHDIRVHQLMLIAKTGKRYAGNLVIRYVVLLAIAIAWLWGMSYLSFFRPVNYHNGQEVTIKTKYQTLQLGQVKNDYYYVKVNRSRSGKHPVVSYTYWTTGNKNMTNSRFGSIADSNHYLSTEAAAYPWNQQALAKEDSRTNHAFAAVMTIRYKNNLLNGLGCRVNHVAEQYTLIRVPASNLIYQR